MFKPFAALVLLVAPAFAFAQSPAVDAARDAAQNYNRDEARTILTDACDGEDAAACRALLAMLDGSYDDEDQAAARVLAGEVCDRGDMLGCVTLWRYAERGRGGDIDKPLMRASITKACQGGLYSACSAAAGMAIDAEGGPQDTAFAMNLYLGACEQGDGVSCVAYGHGLFRVDWDHGRSEEEYDELMLARQYYERGCELGELHGCTSLAGMLIEGQGGEKDLDRARAMLVEACNADIYQCDPLLEAERPDR